MADKYLRTLDIGDGVKRSFLPPIDYHEAMEWIQAEDAITYDIYDIKYGNGIFVMATSNGLYMSIDGTSWSCFCDAIFTHIEYHSINDVWIAVAIESSMTEHTGIWTLFISEDGTYEMSNFWNSTNQDPFYCDFDIAPDGSWAFFECDQGSAPTFFYTCTPTELKGFDVSDYTWIDSFSVGIKWGRTPNGQTWVLWDYGNTYCYCLDGEEWIIDDQTFSDTYIGEISYYDGIWIALTTSGVWTCQAMDWHEVYSEEDYFPYRTGYFNNMWFVVSSNGLLYSTQPIQHWDVNSDFSGDEAYLFVSNENMCLVTTGVGTFYSTDGLNWTLIEIYNYYPPAYIPYNQQNICYGNNKWIIRNDNDSCLYYAYEKDFSSDNGKVLKVINGEWALGTLGEVENDPLISYLTFSGNEDFTLKTYNKTVNWDGTLYYSTDARSWNEWDGTEISSSGNKLYLRGSGNTRIGSGSSNYKWVFSENNTLKIDAIGRIDWLLDWETVLDGGEPEMADYCYCDMFRGCTSLVTAPELPATTLADYCYYYMFCGCTSLVTAPELPATTLAEGCYYDMFGGCTALNLYSTATGNATYAWTAPASTYVSGMFYNVPLDGSGNIGTPTEGTTYYWATPSSSGGTELITFSIGSITYSAEDGMNWQQWLNSEYNIDGYTYNEEYITIATSSGQEIRNPNSSLINLTDEIVQGATYKLNGMLPS